MKNNIGLLSAVSWSLPTAEARMAAALLNKIFGGGELTELDKIKLQMCWNAASERNKVQTPSDPTP